MRPFNPIHEGDRASSVIQRDLGVALRLSLDAAMREPLPEQMAMLLLRLALAELLQASEEIEGSFPLGDEIAPIAVFILPTTSSAKRSAPSQPTSQPFVSH